MTHRRRAEKSRRERTTPCVQGAVHSQKIQKTFCGYSSGMTDQPRRVFNCRNRNTIIYDQHTIPGPSSIVQPNPDGLLKRTTPVNRELFLQYNKVFCTLLVWSHIPAIIILQSLQLRQCCGRRRCRAAKIKCTVVLVMRNRRQM